MNIIHFNPNSSVSLVLFYRCVSPRQKSPLLVGRVACARVGRAGVGMDTDVGNRKPKGLPRQAFVATAVISGGGVIVGDLVFVR